MTDITSKIKYIGVDDLDIDLFESQYEVPNGMSYNSYVILDEKVAVMDTCDARKGEEWKKNLAATLAGRTPDYLVVHHMEPDHAALVADMVAEYPELKVVASAKALQMLTQFFEGIDLEGRSMVVNEGDTLCLGEHTLTFYAAPMIHWPEVMVSYDDVDKVLFSADAFGKFGALSVEEDWTCEARRYYFNICGKYGAQVTRLLGKVANLDVNVICPLHGPVLTENLGYYIGLYKTWAAYEAETEGVLVAYASIHGGTKAVAERMAEILREKGAGKVAVTDLSRDDMAEAVEDAFRMGKMVLAAASYDGNVFPPMHDFLHHLQLKGFRNRRVAIIENGSWAPTAGRVMACMLDSMKDIEIVEPMVTIMSRMKTADEPKLQELADALLAE
ncbi:MAG: FprA family A-type flavoprotein [Bacteroidales bacterium]|nr:FprA family A-type flavoprotein [Bacteroidales bacterium]MCM1148354.1 FprA family A-type flavoprotein [Bacteroidales bacterium]MCM1207027.1 FprA family A-type flavoprotein [Bacillota bacterium]MCM1511297.1 FprA family A-type flavoprotein [Clostridium sp.]